MTGRSFAAMGRSCLRKIARSVGTGPSSERLFAWWWWRSPNRPHLSDRSYIDLLSEIPPRSRGLDLGSRERVREDAICVDRIVVDGVHLAADGHHLPFRDGTFDYVWCNAVLEHVPHPGRVAREIIRTLKPGGRAFIQVPFLESIHGWPSDYYRFTPNGLRVLFSTLREVASGTSAGPGQVLPDLVQYYVLGFSDLQKGPLWLNLMAVLVGIWLLPLRFLDPLLRRRPAYWRWARAFYYVGEKPRAETRPS